MCLGRVVGAHVNAMSFADGGYERVATEDHVEHGGAGMPAAADVDELVLSHDNVMPGGLPAAALRVGGVSAPPGADQCEGAWWVRNIQEECARCVLGQP